MRLVISGFGLLRRLPGTGRVLRALGIGGVPATGYFGAGWSPSTLLVLYWLETVLMTAVVSILILLHRRATREGRRWSAGHTVRSPWGDRSGTTSFLASFLTLMIPFTAGHGVFVAVFVFQAFPQTFGPDAGLSLQALTDGVIALALFLLAGLLFDLPGIGRRPFGWLERLTGRAKARMLITHLTIIFGAAALAAFEAPVAFLAVFVGFKALIDLGSLLPDREAKS
jgi:hypothetical protein